jgi:DNA-binding NtrC family response regulator
MNTSSGQNTIVVVDDDREMTSMLSEILRGAGYRTLSASSGPEALELVRHQEPDLLITDLRMAGMNGHQLQLEIRKIAPNLPTVVITAFGSIQTAVESMKLGAFDYITKPFSNEDLMFIVSRAIEDRSLRQEVRRLRGELARTYGLDNIVAASPKMTELLEMVQRVADNDATVLIRGESGTGKDLIARALHFMGAHRDGPFVPINCAAIPESLLESELFGYERGAFTGAFKSTPGKFEMANGGTILLDEIGDMDFKLQAKLLQVLQDREFLRLGAKEAQRVDVRVMAATHCDLERAILDGRFREDLYYRLNIIEIHVPPMRERKDEILELTDVFLERHAPGEAIELAPELKQALVEHEWPGNVRELENVIRKFLVMRNANVVIAELRSRAQRTKNVSAAARDTQPVLVEASPAPPGSERASSGAPGCREKTEPASTLTDVDNNRKQAEREAILNALNASLWNRKKAAALLKIDYKALLYKMKKLGIGDGAT